MRLTDCAACGGTGRWHLNRSWFLADGYRVERCHACGGTGKNAAKADLDRGFAREQERRRAALAQSVEKK